MEIDCVAAICSLVAGFERGAGLAAPLAVGGALATDAAIPYDSIMFDWNQCPAVERIPGKVSGAWLFKGTRVPVKALFENLESGARIDEFLEWFLEYLVSKSSLCCDTPNRASKSHSVTWADHRAN